MGDDTFHQIKTFRMGDDTFHQIETFRMGDGVTSLQESKCLAGIFQQIVADCKVPMSISWIVILLFWVRSRMLDARFFVAKFLLVIIISLFLLVTRAIHVQGYSAIEIF